MLQDGAAPHGRHAIVTGGNTGIGEAIAIVLAERGMDVGFTWHSDQDGARKVAAKIEALGRRAAVTHLDLARPQNGPPAIDRLIGELGGVDVFVNNAGGGHSTPFLDLDLETWQRVIDVDLTGAFLCARTAARHMVRLGHGGRIVNVTSVHEHVPLKGSAAYCAAKGGLGLLTRVMAVELAEHRITVNAVAPGEIATKMTGHEDVDPRTVARRMIPAGRPGHAREIAEAVAFLASRGGAYTTGASLVVDGGLTLMSAIANQEA